MVSKDFIYPRNLQYSSNLAAGFSRLRSNWTDFRILTGDDVFPCHRIAIAAVSPVIDRMMSSGMIEANQKEVSLNNIPPEILEIILCYIYTGNATVAPHHLIETIIACDYLGILELYEKCVRDAVNIVQPHNVLSCLKVAEMLELDQLKVKCQKLIASSLVDVSQETEFLELNRTEMESQIKEAQEVNSDPDDALQATMSWISHNLNERVNEMEELLQKIQLAKCSIEVLETEMNTHESTLQQCPAVYKILNESLTEIAKQGGRKWKRKPINIRIPTILAIGQNGTGKLLEMNPSCVLAELGTVPEYSRWLSVSKFEDGVVVSGGVGCASCHMFTISTNTWTKLPSLRFTRAFHASIIFCGRLFVFGGCVSGSSSYSLSVESLKIDGGEWCKEPDLPAAIHSPEVACVDCNIFLLDIHHTNQLFQLNMNTKEWSNKEKIPGNQNVNRGASMVSVEGQLLVAGSISKTFSQYNPKTNTWCTLNPSALHHRFGALVYHQQKLYLMGGLDNDGGQNRVNLEEYDFNAKSWSCSNINYSNFGYISVFGDA